MSDATVLPPLPDLLPEAAALSRRWAARCCNGPQGEQPGCAPYHAAWTTLRLLGSITGALTDADFLLPAISERVASLRQPRILISGAADHAMLQMVLQACRPHHANPSVLVVDACRTTLELNQWYAGQMDARVAVLRQDIRDHQDPGAFDLICTHSVLSFIAPEERPKMFTRWHDNLAPGGALVLAQGLRPQHAQGEILRLSPPQVQRFVDRVRADFERQPGVWADGSASEAENLARRFAEHKTLRVVSDAAGIERAARSAGFTIDRLTQGERHPDRYRSSNADRADQALSLRLVASRART